METLQRLLNSMHYAVGKWTNSPWHRVAKSRLSLIEMQKRTISNLSTQVADKEVALQSALKLYHQTDVKLAGAYDRIDQYVNMLEANGITEHYQVELSDLEEELENL